MLVALVAKFVNTSLVAVVVTVVCGYQNKFVGLNAVCYVWLQTADASNLVTELESKDFTLNF